MNELGVCAVHVGRADDPAGLMLAMSGRRGSREFPVAITLVGGTAMCASCAWEALRVEAQPLGKCAVCALHLTRDTNEIFGPKATEEAAAIVGHASNAKVIVQGTGLCADHLEFSFERE